MRTLLVLLVTVSACGNEAGGPVQEGLSLDESTAGVVTGTYVLGADTLRFEARELEPGVISGEVDIDDVTLTVLSHPKAGAADFDGFLADGRTAALTESGRDLLTRFAHDLSEHVTGEFTPVDVLVRAGSWWSQSPNQVALRMEVLADPAHSISSLCSYVYQYAAGTHDCWAGNTSSPYNIRPVQVAYRYDDQSTLYCWNGAWTATPHSDHSTQYGPKMTGDCWGHCGAGCPADGSNQVNTVDCLNHDLCTQMHGTPYGDCNNELSYASDDFAFGSRCNYTTMAYQAVFAIGACP